MKRNKKAITTNDEKILSCTIDSNNLAVVIRNASGMLDSISYVDLILMDDKKQAKRVAKLKKLMSQAASLAGDITETFYSGLTNKYNN